MPENNPTPNEMQQFAKLWAKHQSSAASYIRVFVQDHAHAEDVLQEVAYSAAGSFDRYDANRPFIGWLIAIAKQRIVDHYRREDRRAVLLSDAAMDSLAQACVNADNDPQADERLEALQTCLTKLNDRQRQAIDFRYGQSLTPVQVAEQIGSNTTAVNALIYRVRRLLLDCIRDRMEARS